MKLPVFRFREKKLRMVWTVEKDGRACYLVGTAHFFPYSFDRSLTRLFQKVDVAVFEGPLDEASMQRVKEYGQSGDGLPSLAELLDPAAIAEINRQLALRLDGDAGENLYTFLPGAEPGYFDHFTRGVRPWLAFFSIWSTYLGWEYSVDMQGYHIAGRLGMPIRFLESIDEQLAVLDSIPLEQITRQLNDVKNWNTYQKQYTRAYLAGDMENLLGLTTRFPTRCRAVFSQRDKVLFERMKAIFDEGPAAAFVGSGHIPGVSHLFRRQGYRVTQGFE